MNLLQKEKKIIFLTVLAWSSSSLPSSFQIVSCSNFYMYINNIAAHVLLVFFMVHEYSSLLQMIDSSLFRDVLGHNWIIILRIICGIIIV